MGGVGCRLKGLFLVALLPKDDMSSGEVGAGCEGDVELRAVGVHPRVGQTKQPLPVLCNRKPSPLIGKLPPEDGEASLSPPHHPSLQHLQEEGERGLLLDGWVGRLGMMDG